MGRHNAPAVEERIDYDDWILPPETPLWVRWLSYVAVLALASLGVYAVFDYFI